MTTTIFGLLLIAAAIALARQDAYWRKREKRRHAQWQSRHDTAVGWLEDDLDEANARADRAELDRDVAEQRRQIADIALDRLADDLAMEMGRRAAVELELDLHYLMPTVAGERAKVADRGNVVPLRRGGAS